ncbi:DUF4261 domain-containing protein [uncultured Sulfitobacter sp.]|uniref:DUF4261 domain-containing protein n=1 Tax=uncultured Sulfitobacter sp. TaxID=191468 RepID=UPI0026337DA6|nr:DUF4261 domain-containing protein [uncultured Sulfitobacter sp.]
MNATLMAMVMLREPLRFDADGVGAVLGALPVSAKPKLREISNDGKAVSVALDDQVIALISADTPLPIAEFSQNLERADGGVLRADVTAHTAHLMVVCHLQNVVMGEAAMGAACVHVLAARLADLGQPVAGLWASSMQVNGWAEFKADSERAATAFEGEGPLALPGHFWTAIEPTKLADQNGGKTRGLAAITGYELELTPLFWPAERVVARLAGTVEYLLTHGPILEEGQTLGVTEDERFRITKKRDGTLVLTLELILAEN